MRFIIIDTETTGFDSGVDKIVEFAALELKNGQKRKLFDLMCNPGIEIPAVASAVHHITNRDVVNEPTFEEVWPTILEEIQHEPDTILVAHNAEFDSQFVPAIDGVPWLCTMRFAKHIWPQAPSFKNQVLRYWRGIRIETGMPHRAMPDVEVTTEVLIHLLSEYQFESIEQLISFVNSPLLVQSMPFGKHKGLPIKELPIDYIQCALRKIHDMDADLRYTLEKHVQEWTESLNKQIAREGITDHAWDKPEVSA